MYFWLTVVYHFKIAGVAYTGDRFEITYRNPVGDEEHFRQLLANYKPKSVVEILYDPKDPTRSVVLRPELVAKRKISNNKLSLSPLAASSGQAQGLEGAVHFLA